MTWKPPWDPNNPVYKNIQKTTGGSRKRIRNTVVAIGILAVGYAYSRKKQTGNFFGGPNLNQFGMIRRK